MQNVVYREWVPAGTLVKGLMVTFSAIVILGTLAPVLLMKISIEDVFGIGVAWAVLALVLFLFWNYRGIRIQISSDRLFVYYGFSIRNRFCWRMLLHVRQAKLLLVDMAGLV